MTKFRDLLHGMGQAGVPSNLRAVETPLVTPRKPRKKRMVKTRAVHEMRFLAAVQEHGHKKLSYQQLLPYAGVNAVSDISRYLASAVENGYVLREGRYNLALTLTPKGREHLGKLRLQVARWAKKEGIEDYSQKKSETTHDPSVVQYEEKAPEPEASVETTVAEKEPTSTPATILVSMLDELIWDFLKHYTVALDKEVRLDESYHTSVGASMVTLLDFKEFLEKRSDN